MTAIISVELDICHDFCFFDCPPGLTDISISALIASNFLIIPSLPDMDSLNGYDALLKIISDLRQKEYNLGLVNLGIVFNSVHRNRSLDNYIINESRQLLKHDMFSSMIRSSSVIGQARFDGRPIVYFKEKHPVVGDYYDLGSELMERMSGREILYGTKI